MLPHLQLFPDLSVKLRLLKSSKGVQRWSLLRLPVTGVSITMTLDSDQGHNRESRSRSTRGGRQEATPRRAALSRTSQPLLAGHVHGLADFVLLQCCRTVCLHSLQHNADIHPREQYKTQRNGDDIMDSVQWLEVSHTFPSPSVRSAQMGGNRPVYHVLRWLRKSIRRR